MTMICPLGSRLCAFINTLSLDLLRIATVQGAIQYSGLEISMRAKGCGLTNHLTGMDHARFVSDAALAHIAKDAPCP
jgi:hypothetical protein